MIIGAGIFIGWLFYYGSGSIAIGIGSGMLASMICDISFVFRELKEGIDAKIECLEKYKEVINAKLEKLEDVSVAVRDSLEELKGGVGDISRCIEDVKQ